MPSMDVEDEQHFERPMQEQLEADNVVYGDQGVSLNLSKVG
jgi:hypothetical protein